MSFGGMVLRRIRKLGAWVAALAVLFLVLLGLAALGAAITDVALPFEVAI